MKTAMKKKLYWWLMMSEYKGWTRRAKAFLVGKKIVGRKITEWREEWDL